MKAVSLRLVLASASSLLLFMAICIGVPATNAAACTNNGPCVAAHSEMPSGPHFTHSHDKPCGVFWTTAVPGRCDDTPGNTDNCRADGVTNVIIEKKQCYDALFDGLWCVMYINVFDTDTVQMNTCYIIP